jgi:RimJ/RimL family protein N-acetyltransferase
MAGVRLRDVEPGDLEIFYEHQLDEESAALAQFAPRDRAAFMEHWERRILANPDADARTVEADGEVVGNVVAWTEGGQRLVGYWIGKAFWGRGHATAALGAYLDAVETRPLHARVAPHNTGSIRVLEKCGFRFVGEEDGGDGLVDLVYVL